jgi:hypothetical protein
MGQRSSGSLWETYDPTYAAFRELQPFRIREVLLVSSLYDSYILEEDGLLSESLDAEFLDVRLSQAPRVTQVSTAEAALRELDARPIDLVITMTRLGDMEVVEFGRRLKEQHPMKPLVLLADSPASASRIKEHDASAINIFDQVFMWRGDTRLFLAIIKYIEDSANVEHDTRLAGVRTIILIENSVRFYSTYLPLLYAQLMKQTQALIGDVANARQRLRRLKARPKILLGETFEAGWALFEKYREYTLGIISDARFSRRGRIDPEAGLEFVRQVKRGHPDMPALIQSYDGGLAAKANALGAAFLHKRSKQLHQEILRFLETSLGFGDFVFMLPDGREVGRARNLAEMRAMLRQVPEESLRYHASRNHFSNWCRARTEFALAERMRPVTVEAFPSIEGLRRYLVEAFSQLYTETRRGVVADYATGFDEKSGFARIGSGSMGGKGRGLGFIHSQIASLSLANREGVDVFVPPAAVIGTDVFEQFLRDNRLTELALSDAADEAIAAAFLEGELEASTLRDLGSFVERIRYPIAVRSSSLLEDSYDQPFAGIYHTYMLPNNDPGPEARLQDLCTAVKLVYASTFFRNAKAYLHNTPYRAEEEKMAVVLQQVVGRQHGQYFYPDFAGVARSYNFYPVLDLTADGGIAVAALGFGRTVVEGGRAVRFSPAAPRSIPQFSNATDILHNAQSEFFALDLQRRLRPRPGGGDDTLVSLGLDVAEAHGTLGAVASVYSQDNDAVYDGLSRRGVRLVTFAPILKNELFPLAEILRELMQFGKKALSCEVEIEFAVDLKGSDGVARFGVVQIRPMVVEAGTANLDEVLQSRGRDDILCASEHALGHGRVHDIRDVVYVRPQSFDRSRTTEIGAEVGVFNHILGEDGRPYLLIGPGRWGTADRWLGIPAEWRQISGARAIVETELDELSVEPSDGTHFFQNLTSFGIGYFTVNRRTGGGWVDYAWLDAQPAEQETRYLRHVRLSHALDLRLDGHSRRGLILK